MNRARWISASASAAALGCIAAASFLLPGLNARREELRLTYSPKPDENLPPGIALTQAALGSFRGLAVDYLWARSMRLKEEGKYHEAMQLARWITKLQPHFEMVWSFQAWNMAYNLSEAVRTPDEQWMWIEAGIRLLRDEGIPMNPSSIGLYKELAYIFFHRIGKYGADQQVYFKERFAEEWHALLGPPPDDPAAALAAFQALAEAPADAEGWSPDVRAEAEALRALGFAPDAVWLSVLSSLEASRAWADAPLPALRDARLTEESEAKLRAWLDEPSKHGPRAALLACARAKVLRENYHMDPAYMFQLMRRLGPVDWRHPAAHALYWAMRGAETGENVRARGDFDVLQNDRMALHALQSLCFSGRVSYDPLAGYFSLAPDPRLFDAFEQEYAEAKRREGSDDPMAVAFRETHRGFLMWAVQASYLYAGREQALRYYERLRRDYGEMRQDHYTLPLEDFVNEQLLQGKDIYENQVIVVNDLALRAVREGWALGHQELAQRLLALARRCHEAFQGKLSQVPLTQRRKILELPPFPDVLADALGRFLATPTGASSPLPKVRVWARAPVEIKQRVYDRIRKPLYEEAKRNHLEPETAFPEPPGMEEYRKRHAAEGAEPERDPARPETQRK